MYPVQVFAEVIKFSPVYGRMCVIECIRVLDGDSDLREFIKDTFKNGVYWKYFLRNYSFRNAAGVVPTFPDEEGNRSIVEHAFFIGALKHPEPVDNLCYGYKGTNYNDTPPRRFSRYRSYVKFRDDNREILQEYGVSVRSRNVKSPDDPYLDDFYPRCVQKNWKTQRRTQFR